MRVRRGQLRRDDARLALPALPALPAPPAVADDEAGRVAYQRIKTRDDGYATLLAVLRAERVPDAAEQETLDNEEAKIRERARLVAG